MRNKFDFCRPVRWQFAVAVISIVIGSGHPSIAQTLEQMDRLSNLTETCIKSAPPQNQLRSCTDLVEFAKKADRGLYDAYKFRAGAYEDLKDYDREISDRSEMVKLKPKDTYALVKRAMAYKSKGDLNRALVDYDAVIKLEPNDGSNYLSRGEIYKTKGDFAKAHEDITKAITLTDAKYAANYLLARGDLHRSKGDLDRAIADYDQALSLTPGYVMVLHNRSLVKRAKGDAAGADADIATARKINPKFEDK